ncbi:MAG: peptidoglycan DD-metalloendopeptidase family protein, partial [Anaerolineales bacterium]|nr:peptidoglycan DD-metalloendopeptidase family protein [Anaerolineales bacterium]
YDKYHAGEDWWLARGRTNFGEPVYSIGHGRVTYAEPLGWGRDQGVVIVRHTLSDGSTFLSFYGHLDPPSITLRAGDCVTRGQQVGEIGQPRTAPHLHFEIRTHMPIEPGPGYWWEDPTKAGWLPPSQTIWTQRVMASPGVLWTHEPPAESVSITYLGTVFGDVALTLEGTQLVATDVNDGATLSLFTELPEVASAAIDTASGIVYVADRLGHVDAWQLSDPRLGEDTAVSPLTSLWHIELDTVGTPVLLPLPGGGTVLLARGEVYALAGNGRLLWQQEIGGRSFAWTASDDLLLLSTTGSSHAVWSTNGAEPFTQLASMSGYPLPVGEQIWLYAENGVYRLAPDGQSLELIYALSTGFLDRGTIMALPDGGVLLAHADIFDQRLIAFHEDGSVRWERSYAGLLLERQRLLRTQDAVYLTSFNAQGDVHVYQVDVETAVLTHIFTGGTRLPVLADTWAAIVANNNLLLNIGGGNRLVLDMAWRKRPLRPDPSRRTQKPLQVTSLTCIL